MPSDRELKNNFRKAAQDVKKLNSRPSDDTLLKLYGLYKQSTLGNNNTPKPGMFNIKNKKKWEAWNKNNGMNQNKAMSEYISLVNRLKR